MRRQYQNTSDLPGAIPLFPLAGAIVLPRAVLPLNIFEPRYLAMLDDVLKGERVIGIVQPTGEGGPTGSPQGRTADLNRVGCAARVTSYQETEDGRLLIGLTGLCRFVLGEEMSSVTPYRIVTVDYEPYAQDLVAGHGESEVDRERLLAVLRKFLAARNANADWNSIGQTRSEQLVNWLSLASPFGPKDKQALLEAATLKQRADVLTALAEMALAAGGSSGNDGGGRLQ
ncbi:MAG: LON peptidase substrate-binding domain-containing protein [Hyphomicrobiaceae bacterium]